MRTPIALRLWRISRIGPLFSRNSDSVISISSLSGREA
jgi:hypothetical protein